jgi:anti-sigma factor RsiW
MTCAESEILLHALLDGELDAGHAREVETHLESCPRCAVQLRGYRELQQAMPAAQLRFAAPMSLRRRVEMAMPSAPAAHSASGDARERAFPSEACGQRGNSEARTSSRRSVFKGFTMGSAFSAAVAATLFIAVIRTDHDQSVLGDVLSAHLRSLQGEHLTDVQTSDQHTVKPWFNGKLDVAPPVVDLTAQGFTLVGGRLDYVDGKPVASIVYRRRTHVINLFVAQGAVSDHHGAKLEKVQGFNIRRWSTKGLEFRAISDLGADELQEFGAKFEAALHSVGGT